MDEPHIAAVIFDKISFHLKDFFASDSLHVVAHLETLDVSILDKVALFEQLELIKVLVPLVVNILLAPKFVWFHIYGCLEIDSNGVILSFLCAQNGRLNVVDHSSLYRVCTSQIVCQSLNIAISNDLSGLLH